MNTLEEDNVKILVVDDEFVCLSKMTAFLSAYGQCDAATSGSQAIQLFCKAFARGNPYDLITLDIDMLGMNGLEVLRTICQLEHLKQIPRARKLMVSADGNGSNVLNAKKLGCDGFLVKPVINDLLSATLAKLGLSCVDQNQSSADLVDTS